MEVPDETIFCIFVELNRFGKKLEECWIMHKSSDFTSHEVTEPEARNTPNRGRRHACGG